VENAKAIAHQIALPEPSEAEQQNNSRVVPTNSATAVEPQDTDSTKKKSAALRPILLGSASGSPVYFDPQNLTRPLDNNNIMVTGSSGKGKTQFIKAFSAHLRQQDRNVLMIDFKNDFAGDLHFTQSLGLTCSHVSFDGLPFNPLIPVPLRKPNSDVEYISISEHINGLVDIFRKTFGLGDQQEVAVKNAIRESFDERGIPSRGTVKYDQGLEFPDFNDVGDRLRESNPAAYNRLDPLFDLGIFPDRVRHIRFDSILNFSSVIDISQIQNDRIKNAVAKILVISAHRYYNARPHSGLLKQFFIFDEAHRILDTEFVLQFVRECRAYGVGVLLSSQYPSDFPADISSSLNTKVIHGNGPERDRVKEISRTVGNLVPDEQIAGLGMFQAIIASPQYSGVTFNTLSYPMLLVLLALGKEAHPIETLVVPGIDPTRLDVGHLVDLLMRMGLAELVTGGYRAKPMDE
jgi:DNA phosphorothioation-dependent restriction protein DptH